VKSISQGASAIRKKTLINSLMQDTKSGGKVLLIRQTPAYLEPTFLRIAAQKSRLPKINSLKRGRRGQNLRLRFAKQILLSKRKQRSSTLTGSGQLKKRQSAQVMTLFRIRKGGNQKDGGPEVGFSAPRGLDDQQNFGRNK